MLFSSVTFLFVFLPVVLAIYYAVPKGARNYILLFFSLIFYAWGEPIYVLVMLGSTIVAYETGLFIKRAREKEKENQAKGAIVFSVVVHIGVLLFFKYSDFFISNVNGLFHKDLKLLSIALPLGISFYTFQILSYTIDIYRKKIAVQQNYFDLATYVCLFPQLIAGPIVRYETVEKELLYREETVDVFAEGISRFIAGLGKKVLLANTVGALYEEICAVPDSSQSICLMWMGAAAYTFQIYFDFSGYSDMAIGLGKMFGFQFLENFNYPYISKSITEFWRRWHISLSSWFRDYIYFPLGGSRGSRLKTFRNIFIVWFLTGFWHGASWNFIFWGLFFFVLLVIEKIGLLNILKKLPGIVGHIYTMVFVMISWVIFANDDLSQLGHYLKGMFGGNDITFFNSLTLYYIKGYIILFVILLIAATPYPRAIARILEKYAKKTKHSNGVYQTISILLVLGIFILTIAFLVSSSFNPFLYFRF